jgi:FSR family fosmidomycin resistance protein-like MFS transporter
MMHKPILIAIALVLVTLAHFFVDVMLGIWPVYKSVAEFDLATAGLIVAVGALFGEGSQIIFGSLSDRGYCKAIMIFGLLSAMASAFLIYFVDYGILFSLYLFTCIGSGAFHPSAAGFVASLLPERRGLLMAIFAAGGSLGLAFSQIIFTSISTFFAGQGYLLAIPALCLAAFMIFYRLPGPVVVKGLVYHPFSLKDFGDFFKRSDLRLLYIALVANQTLLWGIIFILPDVLKTLNHMEWVCYGGGHLCLILGGAIMMVPAGYLADKYSARSIMFYASLIACVAFYTLLFFGNLTQLLTLGILFVLGACLAIVHPLGVALGVRLVPDKPGKISAFLMGVVWCLSEALGPGGVGLLSGFFSDYAPVKALATLGCFFIVTLIALFYLPKVEVVPTVEYSVV